VLAADTTVVIDGLMLAKPSTTMTRGACWVCSRRTHDVLTGVVLVCAGRESSAVADTRVRFRPLTRAEIDWYVASGEPHDKAGALRRSGLASRFVEAVDGSYSNVVGLPVGAVRALLDAQGFPPADAAQADG